MGETIKSPTGHQHKEVAQPSTFTTTFYTLSPIRAPLTAVEQANIYPHLTLQPIVKSAEVTSLRLGGRKGHQAVTGKKSRRKQDINYRRNYTELEQKTFLRTTAPFRDAAHVVKPARSEMTGNELPSLGARADRF